MPRASPITPSFNAGELSPYLEGRVDFEQLPKGLRVCENFIPLVQGPAVKRSGSRFVTPAKVANKAAIVLPFIFSDEQAWVLEFGHQYIRFYTNRGQVITGPSTPYEIATPYLSTDLAKLRITQSADIIYIAHPLYPPQKLSRFGATNWTLTEYVGKKGPFASPNIPTANLITASATTGTGITITSDTDMFTPNMVGQLIRLEALDFGGVPSWEAGKAVAAGQQRRRAGNYYEAVNTGTTGGDPPVHTEGSALDGTGTVNWKYLHNGYGVVKITSVTTTKVAVGDVTSLLPTGVTGGAKTWKWALGAWSVAFGYPSAVTFYGDRMYWAGTVKQPQTIWGTVVGDYENFAGGTTDDTALSLTINSNDVNAIRWMTGDEKGLLIGTNGGEWIVRPSNQNEALTPFNIQGVRTTGYGSNFVRPLRVGKAVLFVQRAARKLREFAYLIDVDGFKAPDMTVRSDHITKSGLVDMTYQGEPNAILWAPRADGVLTGFTYDRDQQATGWHRHILGGDGKVESVASIPSPDGALDDVWMVVRRTINGQTVRYIEYLTPLFDHEMSQADAFFVDCGATYSGAPATTISGLGFLEGQTVSILADGSVHPNRVVTGGAIALDRPASKVHVGLGYTARLRTERISAGAADGSGEGKLKRIAEIIFRLYRTLNVSYGPNFDQMDDLELRSSDMPMGSAPKLFSGDKRKTWPGGWETEGCVAIQSSSPTPCCLLALVPVMETSSPR